MILKLQFEIFDLSNESIGITANKCVANILMNHKGNQLKLYELGMKINSEGKIEIDTADLKLIEDAVKETKLYNNLVNGAILKEIEIQKMSNNKEKKK